MNDVRTERKCLFCSAPADSREHVIAEWLSKRMKARQVKFQPTFFSEETGFKILPKIKSQEFKTRQVCVTCNNGWMSMLEVWFQKRLGFLVESHWPKLTTAFVEELRKDNENLMRWMIKTAAIFEKASPQGLGPVVPDEIKSKARQGGLTNFNDLFLMIGYVKNPRLSFLLVKGYPVWSGGVRHDYLVHEDGFTFVICLNHLAIRMVKCPDASPIIKAKAVSPGIPAVPLWLSPARKYSDTVLHTFVDFEDFCETLEVSAN